ncbi:MAG TPA: DUF6788 family protein [Spirochaetia bacterium]|nr:DUF6788 family protein [Spirochaetia bacterium]
MSTDKTELNTLAVPQLYSKRDELVATLPPLNNVMRGSLIERKIRCGKKNCRCATGEGHLSYYLSSLDKNKHTRLDYVPLAWVPLVRERLDKQRLIREIMAELAEINLELMRRREKD